MSLRKKFITINDEGKTNGQIIDLYVKIADDYAIDFANWALNNRERIWRIPPITDEQVLEIFKKEKGL
jgi:hypothetical protein